MPEDRGRWDRLEDLLDSARDLSGDARAEFIQRETSDDPALRAELASLLEAFDGAAEYVGDLREQLLGSRLPGILGEAAAGDGPDPWIGRTVMHYQIVERIGGGGMGVIYRAHDARLDRAVALKFIAPEIRHDPTTRLRLLDEARAASALDHPNICTIHEIGESEDDRLFIVMPMYDGETLRARLDRGALPGADAASIAVQVAQGLAAAHGRGIVHRDVKPENVFITRDGAVKLLDFGLARTSDQMMSASGGVVGTVAYMSPEQAAGHTADARSDVWALGVMLFEMLAGVRPFTGQRTSDVLDRIRDSEPDFTSLTARGASIGGTVRRALAKDPAARYASGGEFLEALKGTGGGTASAGRRQKGQRIAILGVAAAVVLAGATGLVMWRNRAVPGSGAVPDAAGLVTRVLWVDDNPENNVEWIRELQGRGIGVLSALSTSQAVRVYDSTIHQVVVSDMGRFEGASGGFVEKAGLELLAQLRAKHAGVQVVFCTSSRAARTYRDEALQAGAVAVVDDCREVLRVMGL
jgi:serine/threonine-protein kinase